MLGTFFEYLGENPVSYFWIIWFIFELLMVFEFLGKNPRKGFYVLSLAVQSFGWLIFRSHFKDGFFKDAGYIYILIFGLVQAIILLPWLGNRFSQRRWKREPDYS